MTSREQGERDGDAEKEARGLCQYEYLSLTRQGKRGIEGRCTTKKERS